ncbi:alpha-L-glutamate ligase-like protein [Catenovulum agarivorans DS-2]|uniref:Alpha-L-glutamate ligase-like protein n=1 Tax=Catenovulum agarivorans DS-2 TaxID=1328313 RepID=W7QJ78_9ALTE|nr:alpha-L-glutamate ligase-like protein [Catenovulum agarivorans]EWH08992.1 alpha-L-glutamate ligase-like protein [Catenovulum agarivorans DS-2]
MLVNPFKLASLGILGMNERNIKYIARYNERKLYPLVDNKLATKRLLENSDIHVPELIATIEHQSQINNLMTLLPSTGGFVIKPAQGSGGKGILVIQNNANPNFAKPNGSELNIEHLQHHCSNILAGLYSLGGKVDKAIIERLINFDQLFSDYSYEGVPDIRIIIFKGYPVMAMMRLSTEASDGKANLHQGAVGVGLDIANGQALHAVQFGKPVEYHPDTQQKLSELKVPNWTDMLELAAKCYEKTQLGYLGADIVLDVEKGPLLLELNARPGLSIQIANGCGLKPRLKMIEKQQQTRTAIERVLFSQQAFSLL